MTIKINITKEILEKSMYCRSTDVGVTKNCAIAVAVRDLFPNAIVGLCSAYPSNECLPEQKMDLSRDARRFIYEFDMLSPELRIKMIPISFEIEIPDSVIDRIGVNEVNEILSKSLTMEKV